MSKLRRASQAQAGASCGRWRMNAGNVEVGKVLVPQAVMNSAHAIDGQASQSSQCSRE